MGALHDGHLSLLRRARKDNDLLVTSVFVNPIQFGPNEDYTRYPRPLREDAALCRAAGVDVLFLPDADEMYPDGFDTTVTVDQLSRPLCGPFRPGHFQGVATVVLKLFNLVRPTKAYFGMKDYQQLQVIKRMTADLDVPVTIVPCPTVREDDGLARSSRNAYLSTEERRAAALVPAALRSAVQLVQSRPRVSVEDVRRVVRDALAVSPLPALQYLAVADPDTLQPLSSVRGRAVIALAVRIGKTRLIDNVVVEP
jgi:pantoate--beta-alanine ligase